MKFFEPLYIHEQGLRENNEDAFSYRKINENTSCYIVCDGIGGSQKGEVASDLACKSVMDFITKNAIEEPYPDYINLMIRYIHDEFNAYYQKNPASEDMGTTLTLLIFHQDKAIFAHIGDSRIYHIREHEIVFQTQDHSLVNELLINKIITEEEALDYPQKNVITRAIQVGNGSWTKADVHISTDIQQGDYFFLCTDGILEDISNDFLLEILNSKEDNPNKMKRIKEFCQEHSKDNFTALLIAVME